MKVEVLGLDIGGANLKMATANGAARSIAFELWKQPEQLSDALSGIVQPWRFDRLAVTMTGELCDCFSSRASGVRRITSSLRAAFGAIPIHIWCTDGRWATCDIVDEDPLRAASANWLALATFAGRFAPHGLAVLIDVGSTTTDIVPLKNGVPVPQGRTDADRLATGELLYFGIRRTPISAILGESVVAEFFATAHDAFVLLGDIPANAGDSDTPDGRPATVEFAHARLARMIGGDGEDTPRDQTMRLAQEVRKRLCNRIVETVANRMPTSTLIHSGSGEFLASRATASMSVQWISMSQMFGPDVSQAACAYAVSVLASEERPRP